MMFGCRKAKLNEELAEKLCNSSIICVTAFSKRLTVEMASEGKIWFGEFHDSELTTPFHEKEPTDRQFCRINFEVDEQFVPEPFNQIELESWLAELKPWIDTSAVSIQSQN